MSQENSAGQTLEKKGSKLVLNEDIKLVNIINDAITIDHDIQNETYEKTHKSLPDAILKETDKNLNE